jgi:hypothetical protein
LESKAAALTTRARVVGFTAVHAAVVGRAELHLGAVTATSTTAAALAACKVESACVAALASGTAAGVGTTRVAHLEREVASVPGLAIAG